MTTTTTLLLLIEHLLVRLDTLLAAGCPDAEALRELTDRFTEVPSERIPLGLGDRYHKVANLLMAVLGTTCAVRLAQVMEHADLPRLDQAQAAVLDVTRSACAEALADVRARLAGRRA